MNGIRHIAASRKGSVFVTAEFEKRVCCWDSDAYKLISEFDTVLDFGGKRLAVSEDGAKCAAAAYNTYGISMYDVISGSEIWKRKDIKRAQFITFDPSDEKLYIGIEENPMVIINSRDGSGDEKIRAAEKVYFDVKTQKRLLQYKNVVKAGGVMFESPTFTFSDVLGIGAGVVLSSVGGDLMFLDYNSREITWKITPEQGNHFVKLSYSEQNDTVYAIQFNYLVKSEPRFMLYGISPLDGRVKFTFPLPPRSCEFGFAHESAKPICSSGEIYELSPADIKPIYSFEWER